MQLRTEHTFTSHVQSPFERNHSHASSAEDREPVHHHLQELHTLAQHAPHVQQLKAYQQLADNSLLQRKNAAPNQTGLPDNLKSGIEQLSGYSMDDVKVHYNSSKPAQLQAHAYAQGSEIHLAPGQETHLPHEAWHVVQQKQGRVKPTVQLKATTAINDDPELEKEADEMGEKAIAQRKSVHPEQSLSDVRAAAGKVVQMVTARTTRKRTVQKGFVKPKGVSKKRGKGSKSSVPSHDGKKKVLSIKNKEDSYSSGRISHTTRSRGVNAGPRKEAQMVQNILGGSWKGGHMVNDRMGGSGGFDNIVPITASMNRRHTKVENKANNLLDSGHGTEVEYKMEILARKNKKHDNKTINDLPYKFQQTLHIYKRNAPAEVFVGDVLTDPFI